MSGKSLYKKLVDTWSDDDKSQQRARENQFYEKANSEKVGAKPKSKAKSTPPAQTISTNMRLSLSGVNTYGATKSAGASANAAESAENRTAITIIKDTKSRTYIMEKWNIFGKKTTNSPR